MPDIEKLTNGYRCPRYGEWPAIPLYMDQVMLVMEGVLQPFAEQEERVITPTMINNYVKQKYVDPPSKKKYGREHLAALFVVSLLKKVLSMQEIQRVMFLLTAAWGSEAAYDLFCERLEAAMAQAFEKDSALFALPAGTAPHEVVLNAAVVALVSKLVVQQTIARAAEE